VTARAEISRLLAIFNELSENDKDIVLKISETALQSKIIPSVQAQVGKQQSSDNKKEKTIE
jgi:hypothetical protein